MWDCVALSIGHCTSKIHYHFKFKEIGDYPNAVLSLHPIDRLSLHGYSYQRLNASKLILAKTDYAQHGSCLEYHPRC